MTDFTKSQLYITKISRVMETHLTRRFIPLDKPHSRDTLIYVISGTSIITTEDGSVFEAKPGNVIYLAKGLDYSLNVNSDNYRYIVCDFLFRTSNQNAIKLIEPKNATSLERLFRKLKNTFSVTAPDRRIRSMALLYEIYSLLIQNNQDQYVPGSARVRIEHARAFIQENIADSTLSVAALARDAQMSEVHFRKLFAGLYGCSPSRFIIQQRVVYAQKLMAFDELQLEDIAIQSGFSSLPHFCRVFKSVTATTPAVYRRNMQKEL